MTSDKQKEGADFFESLDRMAWVFPQGVNTVPKLLDDCSVSTPLRATNSVRPIRPWSSYTHNKWTGGSLRPEGSPGASWNWKRS